MTVEVDPIFIFSQFKLDSSKLRLAVQFRDSAAALTNRLQFTCEIPVKQPFRHQLTTAGLIKQNCVFPYPVQYFRDVKNYRLEKKYFYNDHQISP